MTARWCPIRGDRKRLAACALVLTLGLAGPALAAANEEAEPGPGEEAAPPPGGRPPDLSTPFFFGEIVVVEDDDRAPPGTVDVIDADTIRISGAVSVGEALEMAPGVSMSVGGRNEEKIWVRGYDQSNVLVLVDGVPVADPYFGDLDLGQLPVFDVARITVSRGGASPLYGPNGLGGVVSISTVQGGPPNRFTGELRATDNATVLAHTGFAGGGDRLGWTLGLGAETSDGWPLSGSFQPTEFQPSGVRVNSDSDRWSGLGRIGWAVSDAGTIHASIRWVDSEKGIPFHTTDPVGFVKFSRFSEWQQTTLAVGYEHEWDAANLRAQLYGHRFDNTLEVFGDPELEELRLESTFDDRVSGGYVVGDWSIGRGHRLGASVHLRRDRHQKFERLPGATEEPTEAYAAWSWSMAVEDRWSVDRRTTLIGSLAVDGLDVAEATSLRIIDGEPTVVEDEPSSGSLVSPQVELRRGLGSGWDGSVAVYRRGRFPTMRQLYGTDPPNPELEPQRTTGIDLGVGWSRSAAVSVRGTVFFNRVDDLITRQGRGFPFQNQDEAEIAGVEIRVDGSTELVDYGAAWTGLDHRFVSSSEGFEEIPLVPDHQLELRGVFHLTRRIDALGVVVVKGDRVAYDRGDAIELDGFAVVDLGLTGRAGPAELSLRFDNVLDIDAELEPGYPIPGRRIWIGCRIGVGL